MGLLEGKKRWLLYPKQDAPLLYPVWPEGCHDPVFEADLEEPDKEKHPAALLSRGYECVLEKGAFATSTAGVSLTSLTDSATLSKVATSTSFHASYEDFIFT